MFNKLIQCINYIKNILKNIFSSLNDNKNIFFCSLSEFKKDKINNIVDNQESQILNIIKNIEKLYLNTGVLHLSRNNSSQSTSFSIKRGTLAKRRILIEVLFVLNNTNNKEYILSSDNLNRTLKTFNVITKIICDNKEIFNNSANPTKFESIWKNSYEKRPNDHQGKDTTSGLFGLRFDGWKWGNDEYGDTGHAPSKNFSSSSKFSSLFKIGVLNWESQDTKRKNDLIKYLNDCTRMGSLPFFGDDGYMGTDISVRNGGKPYSFNNRISIVVDNTNLNKTLDESEDCNFKVSITDDQEILSGYTVLVQTLSDRM